MNDFDGVFSADENDVSERRRTSRGESSSDTRERVLRKTDSERHKYDRESSDIDFEQSEESGRSSERASSRRSSGRNGSEMTGERKISSGRRSGGNRVYSGKKRGKKRKKNNKSLIICSVFALISVTLAVCFGISSGSLSNEKAQVQEEKKNSDKAYSEKADEWAKMQAEYTSMISKNSELEDTLEQEGVPFE